MLSRYEQVWLIFVSLVQIVQSITIIVTLGFVKPHWVMDLNSWEIRKRLGLVGKVLTRQRKAATKRVKRLTS